MPMSDLELILTRQVKMVKLPEPELEFKFSSTRKWRFDLAWPAVKLAVEVEGGTFVQGRHNRGAAFEKDCEKYAEAVLAGWRVLRFTGHQVEDGRALGFIERALAPEVEGNP